MAPFILWLLAPLVLPVLAPVQGNSVASVDLYGVRQVDPQLVLAAAAVETGKPLAESVRDIEARVAALPGVEAAEVSPVYLGNAMVVFVGVREPGAKVASLRPAPAEEIELPAEIVAAYDRCLGHLTDALRKGQGQEDHEDGHALSHYPPMREEEERLLDYSEEYFLELVEVLRKARDPHQRAVAAKVLAYVEDKAEVIPELLYAARDADAGVRNNAVRALSIIARFADDHPELDLEVDPEPFLALIESLTWTDRNKGSAALDGLTLSRKPQLLALLKQRSLPALVEMACWKSFGHAVFALNSLARVAGLSDAEILAGLGRVGQDHAARCEWVASLRQQIEG